MCQTYIIEILNCWCYSVLNCHTYRNIYFFMYVAGCCTLIHYAACNNNPANSKHLYNICTTAAKRLRRWSNTVQMVYKCFLFTGKSIIDCTESFITIPLCVIFVNYTIYFIRYKQCFVRLFRPFMMSI